jgi:AcrR family transcriptional regulator
VPVVEVTDPGIPGPRGVLPPEPDTVEEARLAIAVTRERMAATINAIEARVEEKKEEIKERVDVLRPLRERVRDQPWVTLGIIAAAGLIVGLLTRGDDGEDEDQRALERELELEHLARRIELRVTSPNHRRRPRRKRPDG